MVGGRMLVDESIERPDGTVLELLLVDEREDLDAEERAALHAELKESLAEADAGETSPADAILAEIRNAG